MEHFRIFDDDNPAPAIESKNCLSAGLYGHCVYVGRGIKVLAEDNPAEMVTVHVAAKRRYGTVDMMDELTYDNLEGAFAL